MTKINPWYQVAACNPGGVLPFNFNDTRSLGKIFFNHGGNNIQLKELQGVEEILAMNRSQFHARGLGGYSDDVFFIRESWRKIQVWTYTP